jgi:hypothetical protein
LLRTALPEAILVSSFDIKIGAIVEVNATAMTCIASIGQISHGEMRQSPNKYWITRFDEFCFVLVIKLS